MNYKILQKIIALPLSSTENAVLIAISNYVPKDGNTCFPSYDSIRIDSGASNKTISKVIRVMKYLGVIDFNHRAEVGTGKGDGGKKSNEYSFLFKDISVYRSKGKLRLSKKDCKTLKDKIKELRSIVVKEMEEESLLRKEKKAKEKREQQEQIDEKRSFYERLETVTNALFRKSQNVKNDDSSIDSFRSDSIPSQINVIPSQMCPISNESPEVFIKDFAISNETTTDINNKNQKMVWQEEIYGSLSDAEQDYFSSGSIQKMTNENVDTIKSPSDQTHEEWIRDFDNAP